MTDLERQNVQVVNSHRECREPELRSDHILSLNHLNGSTAEIGHPHAHRAGALAPRLCNATQAAKYLGYASTDILRHLPIQPIRLTPSSGPRWDLRALDALLDEKSGIAKPDIRHAEDYDSPEAELTAWRVKRGW